MTESQFDITPFLDQDEGQHFDRKSLFEGMGGAKQLRDRRAVRDQVAEYVAGFANAEGGVLILGIEDDRSITGHRLPANALSSLLATPCARLRPALPRGFVIAVEGHELIVFDVPAADSPVQVIGNGFPLRIGDQTVQVSESHISALKWQGMAESWESRPADSKLDELDDQLLAKARQGAGLSALSDEEYLLRRKLADRRGREIVLRKAAELLFARLGPDHPNAGVRLFRVIGTERRTGPEHNVEERPRMEGNLPAVIEETSNVISSLLRRPSRLVGNQFREASEYPDFAWREALLNAIAHRDYGVEGAGTEVWLFEDRMEVVSPGALAGNLTTDELLTLRRVHRSRNPRIVRVLVDLGFARDQGEGIPRMFTEMKDAFLPQPSIEATNRNVTVALRNTLTLNAGESGADAGELSADTGELGADAGELGADAGELGADIEEELPPTIRAAIDQLGPRPRRERLRPLIHAICDQGRWMTSAELAKLLNFHQHNLTEGHLAPMVESGQLERRFPGQPNHPRQAYRAVAQSSV